MPALRVANSPVSITLKDRGAALFFDRSTGKFSMLENPGPEEAVSIFDAVQREQWGRQVMVLDTRPIRAATSHQATGT